MLDCPLLIPHEMTSRPLRMSGALAVLLLSTEGARALVTQARFPIARHTPANARAATPLLKVDVAPAASLVLSGALVASAATSTTWPAATVRAGLASLTLLDLGLANPKPNPNQVTSVLLNPTPG